MHVISTRMEKCFHYGYRLAASLTFNFCQADGCTELGAAHHDAVETILAKKVHYQHNNA